MINPSFFFNILSIPVLFILVIGFIIYLVSRLRAKNKKSFTIQDKNWYLQLVLSKEDALGQSFFLLSFFFFGVTLMTLNRDFDDLVSLRSILLATSLVGLFMAYYFRVIAVFIFSLIGLTSWWAIQAGFWANVGHIKSIALLAGLMFIALFFYALGHIHEKQIKFKRFAMVYVILGIIPITCVLFILSTKSGLLFFAEMTNGSSFLNSWQITLSLFALALSFIGALSYSISQKLISIYEALGAVLLMLLFGVIAFLPAQELFIRSKGYYGFMSASAFSNSGVFWAVVFNLTAFSELVGLIFFGYLRKEKWLINLGSLFLLILIIVKFFDSFFTFMDKSIFFISAGLALLVVGWLMEKGRRRLLDEIKTLNNAN